MIIEYVSVRTGAVLDTVTLDDVTGAVLATVTCKGRRAAEVTVRQYGADAPAILRSWSNGAALTREVSGASDAPVSD
jgi:hypothetical protein